ncbi:hypothetical protein BCD48_07815 [Pseudofrankia sp. BMG5.36]|nr:hypothetical protein BCD48_07815 [Pseudofrankia sp. BMG5.36]
MLDRPDLLRLLDRATTKRVTVISAPPGSGKTSLLRAWADRSDLRHRVAYASVDRGQQDTQLFWSALLEAIRGPASSTGAAAPGAATLDGDQWVDAVVAALAEVEPAVLIIDDLHELNLADGRGQLERLVSTLPRSARLVLSSRRNPPIRLHQLRLADELAEIRADDLRFSRTEARELLAASGITLSERAIATLHQRTEGWAAGLRMAVMSLRGHPDPERFVAEFSGIDRAVGEYLMAEMFERQPSMIQNLLLRTALVDRLNGELADLLAGLSGSEQVLLHLEDANAFVVSLNPSRTWFRYHQLFADFLRLELRRRHADEIPDLHRRAAQWLDHHGEIADAVRHLLAAGEWPDAARLLADHLFSLTLDGQEGTIAALLRLFPAGVSVDHPELALAHAAVELAQGRLEEAAARLAQAETHAQSASPDRRPSLAVAVASLRLARARRSGRFTEVLEQVSLLDASTAGTSSDLIAMSSELRAVALMNLGIVETWSGRFADADRHMTEGATLAEAIGRPYLEVTCRAYQAFPSPLSSLATARDRGRQALTVAERHGLTDHPVLAPAMGAIACITVWMGEFEEGERWLRHGWSVVQPDIDPATAVLLHMVTGMVHAGRGEHRSALEALTAAVRAQSLLTGAHILATVIAEWLAVTQARLGMPDEARATIAAFSAEHEPMHGIVLARALISLTEGDPAVALAALGDVRDMAPPPGFPAYALVEAHVLAGLAYLALGDQRAAAASAEAALAAAEPDRLIYPFALFDAAELLNVLPRHQTAHGALLVDVVDLLRETPPPGRDRGQASSSVALSRSELRVLRYLPTNLTRPEIARELGVSIHTVNTHIRNVYAKLGARDRSTAVQQARHLRLLSNQLPSTRPI